MLCKLKKYLIKIRGMNHGVHVLCFFPSNQVGISIEGLDSLASHGKWLCLASFTLNSNGAALW